MVDIWLSNCSLIDYFSFEGLQPTFFFAGGVPTPLSGIYVLTPAPPGGLSS